MTNAEIFIEAAEAADNATLRHFGEKRPSPDNAAGDYWKLVFEATAFFLRRHINGVC